MTKKTKGIFQTTNNLTVVNITGFFCDIHTLLPPVFQNTSELSLSCEELVTRHAMWLIGVSVSRTAVVKLFSRIHL